MLVTSSCGSRNNQTYIGLTRQNLVIKIVLSCSSVNGMMMQMLADNDHHSIEVGHRTIIFTVLFLVFLFALWKLTNILLGIFIAYLLMTAINPFVSWLERFRVPRQLSALVILLTIVAALVSGIAALVPPVVEQTGAFLAQLPELMGKLGIELNQSLISSQLGSIPQNIFKIVSGAFSNAIAVFTILVMTYYLALERHALGKRLTFLFGDGEQEIEELLLHVEMRLGGWFRGQIILCSIIGVAVYIGLLALSIPYAVPLAIIAGVLELVPNIGSTIAAVPAVIVGFTVSPLHGGAVILLYFIIQQLENNFLVPLVMQKAVGLNPLVTIIALTVGFTLGGPIGTVLSVPLVLTSQVLLPYFYKRSVRK